jgi:23S rRNA pseudouridine1911/1915/1917 synthase
MTQFSWSVLYEDNHLLVVNKPAMLPTMGVSDDRPSLISEAKQYLKQKYNKPGNVYLGIVSRLDAPVTGVLIMAKTSKAASRLTQQFRGRDVEKEYWAAVDGLVRPSSGRMIDHLRKDERHRRMHIAPGDASDSQEARLWYETEQSLEIGTLLKVRLETGRKHQIRLQLSHAGHPIIGDRKYGSRTPFPRGIALHARRLKVMHPVKQEPIQWVAPLPASWSELKVHQQKLT